MAHYFRAQAVLHALEPEPAWRELGSQGKAEFMRLVEVEIVKKTCNWRGKKTLCFPMGFPFNHPIDEWSALNSCKVVAFD